MFVPTLLSKIYLYADIGSSGRDLTHTGYGLASIGHVAETARHQYALESFVMAIDLTMRKGVTTCFKRMSVRDYATAWAFSTSYENSSAENDFTYIITPSAQFLDPTNPQPIPSYLCAHKNHLNDTLGPSTLHPY